jgi:hypothetical protein
MNGNIGKIKLIATENSEKHRDNFNRERIGGLSLEGRNY